VRFDPYGPTAAAQRAIIRAVNARRIHRLVALLLLCALAAPPAASAETWVSYPKLLEQVRHGDLIRAIINPQRGDVEIKFRNLDEWHAYYPRAAQRELQRLIDARHVRLIFVRRHHPAVKHPSPVHHHLRYIAAGILAAGLLAGAAFLIWRRRAAGGSPTA
jgi:hypothetical protein